MGSGQGLFDNNNNSCNDPDQQVLNTFLAMSRQDQTTFLNEVGNNNQAVMILARLSNDDVNALARLIEPNLNENQQMAGLIDDEVQRRGHANNPPDPAGP